MPELLDVVVAADIQVSVVYYKYRTSPCCIHSICLITSVRLCNNTPLFYIIIYIASLKMNYDGAEGLEFGGGNTKVDPSVLSGQQPSGTHEWKRTPANANFIKNSPKDVK